MTPEDVDLVKIEDMSRIQEAGDQLSATRTQVRSTKRTEYQDQQIINQILAGNQRDQMRTEISGRVYPQLENRESERTQGTMLLNQLEQNNFTPSAMNDINGNKDY